MIKKIAILTSGGDAPGMNNAVVAVINTALANGITPYVVYEGYKGLVAGNFKPVDANEVHKYLELGGTFIYSARLPEFAQPEVREVAVSKFKAEGIEALVVIGGDGSYLGAARLTEMGIPTIGLPGTIDNDISSSDYTIGFFTALETVRNALKQIRDMAESHERCMVVEVMGRYCGDLAIHGAIANGAEVLSAPERKLSEDEIAEQVKKHRANGKRGIIVVVTEHQYDVDALAKHVEAKTGVETRANVLGHMQRGGNPVAMDRIIAAKMGNYAVKLLLEGKSGLAVGITQEELSAVDILKAVEMPRPSRLELIKIYEEIK